MSGGSRFLSLVKELTPTRAGGMTSSWDSPPGTARAGGMTSSWDSPPGTPRSTEKYGRVCGIKIRRYTRAVRLILTGMLVLTALFPMGAFMAAQELLMAKDSRRLDGISRRGAGKEFFSRAHEHTAAVARRRVRAGKVVHGNHIAALNLDGKYELLIGASKLRLVLYGAHS